MIQEYLRTLNLRDSGTVELQISKLWAVGVLLFGSMRFWTLATVLVGFNRGVKYRSSALGA